MRKDEESIVAFQAKNKSATSVTFLMLILGIGSVCREQQSERFVFCEAYAFYHTSCRN